MHDILLFILAVVDDLARLVTEQNISRLLIIAATVSVVVLVVGLGLGTALFAGRAVAAVARRFTTKGACRLERENALLRQHIIALEQAVRTLSEDRCPNRQDTFTPRWKGGNA